MNLSVVLVFTAQKVNKSTFWNYKGLYLGNEEMCGYGYFSNDFDKYYIIHKCTVP